MSLEQIRTVSFDHPAYLMYGKTLTVRLHFVCPEVAPIPILNVQFGSKDIFGKQLVEQHTKMVIY